MIHGSAEARLSRLPAMAGIMALFTSILDTARYSIAAKLSGGGRGGPAPYRPPHHPIVRAAPPRKTAPPPTTGRNKSSVFRHFAVGRRSRAAKSRAVAIFTAGPPSPPPSPPSSCAGRARERARGVAIVKSERRVARAGARECRNADFLSEFQRIVPRRVRARAPPPLLYAITWTLIPTPVPLTG